MTAEEMIKKLNLEPLPEEGGFFREAYRSSGVIPKEFLPQHGGERNFSTQIYYLITPSEFGALHRVKLSDEYYHFYLGDPVEMVQIEEDGSLRTVILGQNIPEENLQVLVKKGVWQGTRLMEGGKWALIRRFSRPSINP